MYVRSGQHLIGFMLCKFTPNKIKLKSGFELQQVIHPDQDNNLTSSSLWIVLLRLSQTGAARPFFSFPARHVPALNMDGYITSVFWMMNNYIYSNRFEWFSSKTKTLV